MKQLIRTICAAGMVALFLTSPAYADRAKFDADKMLSDLESQLKLSGDKLNKLKPALDAKSQDLQKSIHESVDEGFMQLEALSGQLDEASREAAEKLSEALSGEEMHQIKAYLKKIDGEAIKEIRDELVAQLSQFLKLTEDQIAKVKPILEDGFDQLGEMLDRLKNEGSKSLEGFRSQFEGLNKDMNQRLRDSLDSEQIKALDSHHEELTESIRKALDFK